MDAGDWTAVGAIATAIGVLAAIIIAIANRSPSPKLVVSRDDDFRVAAPGWAGLTISHDGEPIANAVFVSYLIVNTGRQPVRANDWDELAFVVEEPSRIIAGIAEHHRQNQADAPLQLSEDSHGIELRRILLNPKESIAVQLLLDSRGRDVVASVRAAGFETTAARMRDEVVDAVLPTLLQVMRDVLVETRRMLIGR